MDDSTINNHYENLKNLKSNSSSLGKNLKMKHEAQEEIFRNFENNDLNQCIANFGKLKDNSKQIYEIMLEQNNIAKDTFSLTEEILNSLKTYSKNIEILRYRDWVTKLIKEIKIKLDNQEEGKGSSIWNKIYRAFSIKIDEEKVNFRRREMPYIKCLKEILEEVDITIEEFEVLMKLKLKSNNEFHKGSQTIGDANDKIETFPKDVRDPLQKAIKALEIWRKDDDDS